MDPRAAAAMPQIKKANHSPVMQARAAASLGSKVNFCPYGCTDADLDDNWYCRHLVGFTNNTEQECKAGLGLMEPMVMIRGLRKIMVKMVNRKPVLEKVLASDHLERATCSCRVYRKDVPPEPEMTEEELEAATRP